MTCLDTIEAGPSQQIYFLGMVGIEFSFALGNCGLVGLNWLPF